MWLQSFTSSLPFINELQTTCTESFLTTVSLCELEAKTKKILRDKIIMLGVGVTAVMVAMEFLLSGLSTLTKAALNKGLSSYVLVVYSNAFAATFILLPSSLIRYRKRSLPLLTFSIISRIFLLGLLSCFGQTCLFTGLEYSSPTLASAIINLNPAFTFILAIISRMEKLDLRTKSCLAKSIGTMVSIAGALTATLYHGPAIASNSSLSNLRNEFLLPHKNSVIGGLILASGGFSLSVLFIVQTSVIKDYPEELMATFICSVFATFQSTVVAVIVERNPGAWKITPDIELIAIGAWAIGGVAFQGVVLTWACHKKGPVYVSLFKPLGIVVAVVMGVTLLGDTLHLGSVIGAAIIVFGFYSVIWGQAQEGKPVDREGINSFMSSSSKAPLLQQKSLEV